MRLYRYFLDGIPWYLARYYWWAYLWPVAVWFFDHQPIINAILFGQYNRLMTTTLTRLGHAPTERVLQLTCVYGSLTPRLLRMLSPQALHLADVAPVQLKKAQGKAPASTVLYPSRMNAERLGYRDNVFSTVVLFFLLHEMPLEARENTLSECMRIISPGGSLLITEYAPMPSAHWLYRFAPARWLLTRLEPFLDGFWQDNLLSLLGRLGTDHGKMVRIESETLIFSGFYRVTEFRISSTVKSS